MSVPPWKQAILERRKKQEEEQRKQQSEDEAYLASLPPWKRALVLRQREKSKKERLEKEGGSSPGSTVERSDSFTKWQKSGKGETSKPPWVASGSPTPTSGSSSVHTTPLGERKKKLSVTVLPSATNPPTFKRMDSPGAKPPSPTWKSSGSATWAKPPSPTWSSSGPITFRNKETKSVSVVEKRRSFEEEDPKLAFMPAWKKALILRRRAQEAQRREEGEQQRTESQSASSKLKSNPPETKVALQRNVFEQQSIPAVEKPKQKTNFTKKPIEEGKDETDAPHTAQGHSKVSVYPSPSMAKKHSPSPPTLRKPPPVSAKPPSRLAPKPPSSVTRNISTQHTHVPTPSQTARAPSAPSTNASKSTGSAIRNASPPPKNAPTPPATQQPVKKTAMATTSAPTRLQPTTREVVNRNSSDSTTSNKLLHQEGVTLRAPVFKEVEQWANVSEEDPKFLNLPQWKRALILRRRADIAKRTTSSTTNPPESPTNTHVRTVWSPRNSLDATKLSDIPLWKQEILVKKQSGQKPPTTNFGLEQAASQVRRNSPTDLNVSVKSGNVKALLGKFSQGSQTQHTQQPYRPNFVQSIASQESTRPWKAHTPSTTTTKNPKIDDTLTESSEDEFDEIPLTSIDEISSDEGDEDDSGIAKGGGTTTSERSSSPPKILSTTTSVSSIHSTKEPGRTSILVDPKNKPKKVRNQTEL